MMAVNHKGDELTPQQEEEVKRLKEKVMAAVEQKVEQMARLAGSCILPLSTLPHW